MLGIESEAGAERWIVLRAQEWFQVEAAADAGELLGAANASGQVLPGHGIGHTHKMGRAAPCIAFGGAKNLVGYRALERAKGRNVDGLDDDVHPGAPRNEAAY